MFEMLARLFGFSGAHAAIWVEIGVFALLIFLFVSSIALSIAALRAAYAVKVERRAVEAHRMAAQSLAVEVRGLAAQVAQSDVLRRASRTEQEDAGAQTSSPTMDAARRAATLPSALIARDETLSDDTHAEDDART